MVKKLKKILIGSICFSVALYLFLLFHYSGKKGLYRYCPWMRGMATSQISCNNGIDKKASHVPL